jgi:hypothetical protein
MSGGTSVPLDELRQLTPVNNVPLPPGAVGALPWAVDRGQTIRQFRGDVHTTSARVLIWGVQDISGAVLTRRVLVEMDRAGIDLDSATARELAANLLARADEIDRLQESK